MANSEECRYNDAPSRSPLWAAPSSLWVPMPHDPSALRRLPLPELVAIARSLSVENPATLKKQDLVAAILREECGTGSAPGEGILEVLPDGFGFLRAAEWSFAPGSDDVYVSPSQIRRFNLRNGDRVRGQVRAPKENERYFALIKLEKINDLDPEQAREKPLFDNLTPIWPRQRLRLEHRPDEAGTRMIDLFCPLGKGSRSVLVTPPRAGCTTLLIQIAKGIAKNHPEVIVMPILLGERPEDVQEIWHDVAPLVLATTAEESDSRHVQVAELGIERARRMVEAGQDVVVLVDGLTRLGRAAQGSQPGSGRTTTGGWDPLAVQKVRSVLGAARALKEGGSLTVIGAVLVGTGSRVDEALLEELQGMENHTITLDRALADRRIFPALDIPKCSTQHEEHLWSGTQLSKVRALRTTFPNAMGVLGRVSRTRTNAELLDEGAKTGEKAG